ALRILTAHTLLTTSHNSTTTTTAHVTRESIANECIHRVRPGSTRYASPPEPERDSNRTTTANNRIRSTPTQYTGNDTPRYDTSMARRSTAPPGRMAERTPSVIPLSAARSMAGSASWTVVGNRAARAQALGRGGAYERSRRGR